MSVFNTTKVSAVDQKCFFDAPVNIARYDKQRYPIFEKLTAKSLGFFWQPEEFDLSRDSKDFRALNQHERHIFTSNLKRQILLDSIQGRAPSIGLLPIVSLPELETFIQTWTFFETIHSRSYTHIIRNVYSDPSIVFDELLDVPEIVECAGDISKYYDSLIDWNNSSAQNDFTKDNKYNHKRALWLCLNAVNALEGVRFYVSFACSWAFAEVKKMEGNAKIIKLIARDENIHLAATQNLLKILPKEDNDFAKIQQETREECRNIFNQVADQEKSWARYLFKDGSMIGLNEALLCEYIDHIASKRTTTLGFDTKPIINPLPWTTKWIAGSEVQVAPQQTQISSYVAGGVKQDIDSNTFSGFTL